MRRPERSSIRRASASPKKWRLRCPAVVECLQEAGDDLFTFLSFPKAQWKALRTTNALERINGEFRRRTKNPTQSAQPRRGPVAAFRAAAQRPGEDAKGSDGWHEMERVKAAA